MSPRRPQEAPQEGQNEPRRPKMSTRRSKMSPRRPKMSPRRPQEARGWAGPGPGLSWSCPWAALERPTGGPKPAPATLSGLPWGCFWEPPGAPLGSAPGASLATLGTHLGQVQNRPKAEKPHTVQHFLAFGSLPNDTLWGLPGHSWEDP